MRKFYVYSIILLLLLGIMPNKIEASGTMEEPEMQVKLVNYLGNKTSISLGITGSYSLDGTTTVLSSGKNYSIKVENNSTGSFLTLYDGTTEVTSSEKLSISPVNDEDRAVINNREYFGSFDFIVENQLYVRPINKIKMEDYIKSVVPHEMYATWNKEALKVQAVAARTYAYYRLNQIIDDTTAYQAYGGAEYLTSNSNAAVDETAGEILLYNGKPIEAVYSASNGGMTESNTNEWGGTQLPYLPIQKDEFDTQIKWNVSISKQQINTTGLDLSQSDKWWNGTTEKDTSFTNNIKTWLNQNGYSNKQIKIVSISNLDFYKPTGSGRVERADLSFQFFVKDQFDVNGMLTLQNKDITYVIADTIRSFIGTNVMTSTLISNQNETESAFILSGTGNGHGVGMSQHGANNRANAGQTYKDILAFYYPGTVVQKQYDVNSQGPTAPKVNGVTQIDRFVTGTADPNSTVYVKVGAVVIGSGKSSPQGNFTIGISEQQIGTKLGVVARQESGNYSNYTFVTVTEKAVPLAPKVNAVTNKSTTVIGTAEVNSVVYVKVGSTVIGRGNSDSQGNFFIDIPLQPLGTKISVVVRDAAGNYSPYTYVIVGEKVGPFAPKVDLITDKSTVVTGLADPNSSVYVKVGTEVIGTGVSNSQGLYSVEIPLQSSGTKLAIMVKDAVGNYGPYTYVTVMEKTAPFAPNVDAITNQSTTVTGKAEANSTVYVKVGSVVIGKAKSDSEGKFTVKVPLQQVGTKIGVVVRDSSGKYSLYTNVIVQPSQ